MKGMLGQHRPLADLQAHVESDEWTLELKLDGVRLMIHVTDGELSFNNREEVGMTFAAAAQWFPGLAKKFAHLPNCVLDGELIIETGRFVAFDLPWVQDLISPTDSLEVRKAALATLGELYGVETVTAAATPAEKLALWEQVVAVGAEGVVARRRGTTYQIGRRSPDLLKFKISHTIDAVIVERNRGGKTNAVLGLYREGVLTEIGQMSMLGKTGEVGDVCEVEFQTIRDTKNPGLISPRLSRLRPDRSPESVLWDQIADIRNAKDLQTSTETPSRRKTEDMTEKSTPEVTPIPKETAKTTKTKETATKAAPKVAKEKTIGIWLAGASIDALKEASDADVKKAASEAKVSGTGFSFRASPEVMATAAEVLGAKAAEAESKALAKGAERIGNLVKAS